MKLDNFFSTQPVFTYKEFVSYLDAQGTSNPNTQRELLAYHIKQNHIVRIRRRLFAVVPRAIAVPSTFIVDPYLIASKVSEDAVLSYHTAFDIHGVAYSSFYSFYYSLMSHIGLFQFQNHSFKRIQFPSELIKHNKQLFAVETRDRLGLDVKVTSLERTLVDVLNKPNLCGGWEEIWQSMSHVSVLDIDLIIAYAFLLDNATLIAKVGFFLEQNQIEYAVTDKQLAKLEARRPRSKHYFDKTDKSVGQLIPRWNLVIPVNIINKNWEEPHANI